MAKQSLRIVTNVTGLSSVQDQDWEVKVRPIHDVSSVGAAVRLLRANRNADVLLVDGRPDLLKRLCLARLLWPRQWCGGPALVSIDLVLNRPSSLLGFGKVCVKRLLLRQVDHFIHYFVDLTGYARWYGVSAARSTFIPFKANNFEVSFPSAREGAAGDYVLTSGRSLRDYDTFMAAMTETNLPGRLVYCGKKLVREHGTPFPPRHLPPNVGLHQDDGSAGSWVTALRGARVVVIPILPESIRAAGISMALDAMALGKCVIITESPTTRGVFRDEVVTVPPENPHALAVAIDQLWHDEESRFALSERALRYARSVGGEAELYQRLIKTLVKQLVGRNASEQEERGYVEADRACGPHALS